MIGPNLGFAVATFDEWRSRHRGLSCPKIVCHLPSKRSVDFSENSPRAPPRRHDPADVKRQQRQHHRHRVWPSVSAAYHTRIHAASRTDSTRVFGAQEVSENAAQMGF
jgi:hypothetical protein